ncbi:cytochrome P450 [Nostoc sp. NIES-4103]|nr:cytochrome P450 [Nostoc sp. NIES-4103]
MKLPDGPKSPPIMQVIQWMFNPLDYLEEAVNRYGEIFTGRMGLNGAPIVLVSNPQAIQQIFQGEFKEFGFAIEQKKFLEPLVGKYSVVILDGQTHRQHRQLLMPPFHGKRMQTYGQLICDITAKVMNQLPLDQPFVTRQVMKKISLEVMLQAVFGLQTGESGEHLKKLLISWLDFLGSPIRASFLYFTFLQKDLGAWSPWSYFCRLKQDIKQVLYQEINYRRQNYDPERSDILTLLLSARDENNQGLTDEELHDEVLGLLIAGHEITAAAMTWGLYWIHHQPHVGEKLLAELHTLGDLQDPVSISQLPYLTAVCQETLRIYPTAIAASARVVNSPVDLNGYKLEPGTMVMPCTYLVHHRQDLYSNSHQFLPERFLERQFSPYEYLPFGGGNRRCIGAALSMFEMKLVLATITSKYQLDMVSKQPIKPQYQGFLLAPTGGVKMRIISQRQPVKPLAKLQRI